MPTSSSDAIRPVPDGAPMEPIPAPTREPSALDEPSAEAVPLEGSESGEFALGSGSGSSTFAIPPGLIVPDPVLRALSEVPSSSSAEQGGGPVPDAVAGPAREAGTVSSSTGSVDPIGTLGLSGLSSADRPAAGRGKDAEPEDDVEIEYVNGPNWPMVLLASYASAVTLALIWWVVLPRLRGEGGASSPTVAAGGTRQADRSRRVEPAVPIPPDRITTLRRPLRVGSLEVTPIEVARADVKLRRAGLAGREETKEGDPGAMALRLRLRNTSDDAVFAPLDPAFVRDRDDGLSDSFVEIDGGERVYPYPLPVDSEWSIVGQSFPELKPGEAGETQVVTDANFPPTASGMTWRLRLRTGLNESATIGVRVPAAE